MNAPNGVWIKRHALAHHELDPQRHLLTDDRAAVDAGRFKSEIGRRPYGRGPKSLTWRALPLRHTGLQRAIGSDAAADRGSAPLTRSQGLRGMQGSQLGPLGCADQTWRRRPGAVALPWTNTGADPFTPPALPAPLVGLDRGSADLGRRRGSRLGRSRHGAFRGVRRRVRWDVDP